MRFIDLIDNDIPQKGLLYTSSFEATSHDEHDLVEALARLLKTTKSVQKTTHVLNCLSDCEYMVQHSFPPVVVFNNSDETNDEILKREINK